MRVECFVPELAPRLVRVVESPAGCGCSLVVLVDFHRLTELAEVLDVVLIEDKDVLHCAPFPDRMS